MKLFKGLTPILIASLATTSASLVGCTKKPEKKPEPVTPSPPAPDEYDQFISDRTFSLMAYSIVKKNMTSDYYYGEFCYGTGWIIDDATPNVSNDYKYHVATNWHVTNGFNDLATKSYPGYTYITTVYNYGDRTSTTDLSGIIDSLTEYTELGEESDGFYKEETDPHTFMYEPYASNIGIDVYEADINFASQDSQVVPITIKDKLDRLNTYRTQHGYINNFVCGDDPTIQAKTKYIGGYPMKESPDDEDYFGGRWETHIVNSDLSYVSYDPHDVGSSNVLDYSPQYESSLNMGEDWMSGGASGSMIITEDFEICGIYWGGWKSSKTSSDFYPSFSLFNTTNYNFLHKYIHTT